MWWLRCTANNCITKETQIPIWPDVVSVSIWIYIFDTSINKTNRTHTFNHPMVFFPTHPSASHVNPATSTSTYPPQPSNHHNHRLPVQATLPPGMAALPPTKPWSFAKATTEPVTSAVRSNSGALGTDGVSPPALGTNPMDGMLHAHTNSHGTWSFLNKFPETKSRTCISAYIITIVMIYKSP